MSDAEDEPRSRADCNDGSRMPVDSCHAIACSLWSRVQLLPGRCGQSPASESLLSPPDVAPDSIPIPHECPRASTTFANRPIERYDSWPSATSPTRRARGRGSRATDDEALHDFRVALRRLRSWERAFRPYLRDDLVEEASTATARLARRHRREPRSRGAPRLARRAASIARSPAACLG